MTARFTTIRHAILVLVLLLAAVVVVSFDLAPPGRQREPAFSGAILPETPERKKPRPPPESTLPKPLLSATTALFKAGLTDPCGGEYRVIKVGIGNCWSGDAGVVETHGWVLPANNDANRFAVCWNGLLYSPVSIGEKADLQADVLAVINADEKSRAGRKDFYRFRNAASEGFSVSHQSMLPIKTCLLLRLGKGELAQKLWNAWIAGMRANTNDDDFHLKDPYLMLATDWVWARFDRAVCAHMRGDDRLAVVDARALVGMKKAVLAEASERGVVKENDQRGRLDFLAQVPDLLADQERRAKVPKREPVPEKADKARRIAALIQDLEDVRVGQFGQPGGVNLAWAGEVQALIKEGDAAVEPLIDCLEKDERLTRSVHFHRDFFRHRSILGVHEAAYVALAGILQTSFFGTASTGDDLTARGEKGRKQVAANIRAYWKRFKDVPLEERWYLLLKNDNVPPGHWLQAAANITRPVAVSVSRGSMFGTEWTTVPEHKPAEKPALRGDVLRKLKDPTVAELFVKRTKELRQSGIEERQRRDGIQHACEMAYHLAQWDLKTAQPELKILVKACREYMAGEKQGDGRTFDFLGPAIATLTQWRLRAGDSAALDDYAAWIRTIQPNATSHSFKVFLAPMWENPDNPAVAAAAKAMFNDASSPWTKRFLRAFNTYDLFTTPMLGLAGFRKRLIVELTDRGPTGKIKLDEEGYGCPEVDGSHSGGAAVHFAGDPLAPPPGTKEVSFRVCDYYAWGLSAIEGFPRCELYWPQAERDKGVAACAQFLTKYGDRLKYSREGRASRSDFDPDRAYLTFPRLDRPATIEDARAVRAIFTLAGKNKVRVCKMPAFPRKARWFTLKDFPNPAYLYAKKLDPKGPTPEFLQEGRVWQAEEVLEEGKWRRYYGFVGNHIVAKVPAEQIEFPAPDAQ